MAEPGKKERSHEKEAATSESERADEGLLESLRRERADFLNYKRRIERERAEDRTATEGELIRRLLPLLDDLDRALARVPKSLEHDPWTTGIAMSRKRLERFLDELGLERLGKPGEQFNPDVHEAVLFEQRPGVEENQVAEVMQPGYRLGGRLLRPAQVLVVGPESESKSETRDESRPHGSRRRAA